MSPLDQAIQNSMATIPDCIAAGYVDLPSGMLLGMKGVGRHPKEAMELLSAATADLFQGPNVTMIETMFREARGTHDGGRHYFQEIIVNSDNLIHIFLRARTQQQAATFVCRKSANLGMSLVKARMAMPAIEAAL